MNENKFNKFIILFQNKLSAESSIVIRAIKEKNESYTDSVLDPISLRINKYKKIYVPLVEGFRDKSVKILNELLKYENCKIEDNIKTDKIIENIESLFDTIINIALHPLLSIVAYPQDKTEAYMSISEEFKSIKNEAIIKLKNEIEINNINYKPFYKIWSLKKVEIIIAIFVGIFAILYYITNLKSCEKEKINELDLFYLTNAPNVSLMGVSFVNKDSLKNDGTYFYDSTMMYFNIGLKNNSNQQLNIVSIAGIVSDSSGYILRRRQDSVPNNNNVVVFHNREFENIIEVNKDENYFKLNTIRFKKSFFNKPKTNVHTRFVFKSDKNITFDKYIIFSVVQRDSIGSLNDIISFEDFPKDNPKILENVKKKIDEFSRLKFVSYFISKYISDTHVYLTNENVPIYQ